MIEKISAGVGNCEPMRKVGEYIRTMKETKESLTVAEIGTDIGATSVEIVNNLTDKDSYYFFDFEDKIQELYQDLKEINVNRVRLFPSGNSHKKLDSYAWNLAKLFQKNKESFGNTEIFDIVYLDGAHTFVYDGVTICLLKEMMQVGGVIILDDMSWSIAESRTCKPSVNPAILDYYTMEQIETKQVAMAAECFLDSDRRYKRIDEYHRIAIYKRLDK